MRLTGISSNGTGGSDLPVGPQYIGLDLSRHECALPQIGRCPFWYDHRCSQDVKNPPTNKTNSTMEETPANVKQGWLIIQINMATARARDQRHGNTTKVA